MKAIKLVSLENIESFSVRKWPWKFHNRDSKGEKNEKEFRFSDAFKFDLCIVWHCVR